MEAKKMEKPHKEEKEMGDLGGGGRQPPKFKYNINSQETTMLFTPLNYTMLHMTDLQTYLHSRSLFHQLHLVAVH